MLDKFRSFFIPEPLLPPLPDPLKEEAAKERKRADEIVERLDLEHEQHVRRQRMDPGLALRLARERRGGD